MALPALSRTTTVRMCEPAPLASAFHAKLHGAAVSSAPTAAPSTSKITPPMPLASYASTSTVTVPDTASSSYGLENRTTGSNVSGGVCRDGCDTATPSSSSSAAVARGTEPDTRCMMGFIASPLRSAACRGSWRDRGPHGVLERIDPPQHVVEDVLRCVERRRRAPLPLRLVAEGQQPHVLRDVLAVVEPEAPADGVDVVDASG